jgi:hypothetical protein
MQTQLEPLDYSHCVHVAAESFEVLIDRDRPVVGLMVNPPHGPSFIIPLALKTALGMASMLVDACADIDND